MGRRSLPAAFAALSVAACGASPAPQPGVAPATSSAAPLAAAPPPASTAVVTVASASSAMPPRAPAEAAGPTGWHVAARFDAGDAISDYRIDDGRRLIVVDRGDDCDPKAAVMDGTKASMLPAFTGLAAVIPSLKKGTSCSVHRVAAASPTELVMSVAVGDQCHVVGWKSSAFTHLGTYPSNGSTCGPITRYHGGALVVTRHADASIVPTLRAFGASERAPEVARYRGKNSQFCGSFLTTIWAMRAFDDGNVVLVGTPCGIPNVILERTRLTGKRDLPTASKLVIDYPSHVFIESATEVSLLSAVGDDGLLDATMRLAKGTWAATPPRPTPAQPEVAPIPKTWTVDSTALVARTPTLLVLTPAKVKKGQPIVVSDVAIEAPLDFRRASAR